jgi:hypothetical protein
VPAPIALFAYSRPEHLRKTLEALSRNHLAAQSTLHVYADGPKPGADGQTLDRIRQVRAVLREPWGFATIRVVEREANVGLANSVIAGVTEVAGAHGQVIVLEDDLVTSTGFLRFMNQALETYADAPQVMQVSGYQFPIEFPAAIPEAFFLPFTTSWGWATWKRAWDRFDPHALGWQDLRVSAALRNRFNLDGSHPYSDMLVDQMQRGTLDSWAIRWWWSVFRQDGIVLHSRGSLVRNIGFDQLATHTKSGTHLAHGRLESEGPPALPLSCSVHQEAYGVIKSWLARSGEPAGLARRVGRWMSRWQT